MNQPPGFPPGGPPYPGAPGQPPQGQPPQQQAKPFQGTQLMANAPANPAIAAAQAQAAAAAKAAAAAAAQQPPPGPPPGYGAPPGYGQAPPPGYGQAPPPGYGPPPGGGPPAPAYGAPAPNAFGGAPPGAPGPYWPQQGQPGQAPGMPGQPPGMQGQAPYGQGGYGGGPPQGAGAYGAPPSPYGAPPGPPPGYGGQQPGGYGPPGAGPSPYGQQPPPYGQQQGMQPYAQQGALGAIGGAFQSAAAPSSGPTRRNPVMALLPLGVIIGGNILTNILVRILFMVAPGLVGIGSLLGSLVSLAGAVLLILNTIKMVNEVKSVTRNDAFAWWPILIPIYSIYWVLILLPQEVTKAKQMLGVQKPTGSIVLYFFLFPYALASDINDMVR